MNQSKMRRLLLVACALGGALVAALFANRPAVALESDLKFINHPAAFCNHNGLSPNGAVGLGNWSGANKSAYCPFITDTLRNVENPSVVVWGAVSCTLRQLSNTGTTYWSYNPTTTYHETGYDRIVWGGQYSVADSGVALECVLPHNTTIQSYWAGIYSWDHD